MLEGAEKGYKEPETSQGSKGVTVGWRQTRLKGLGHSGVPGGVWIFSGVAEPALLEHPSPPQAAGAGVGELCPPRGQRCPADPAVSAGTGRSRGRSGPWRTTAGRWR